MSTSNTFHSQTEIRVSSLEILRSCVEAETGMDFSGTRLTRLRDAVEKVLSRIQSTVPLDRILASSQERGVFLERLTAELTVGESFFFRNEHHIQALRERVLPEILRDNLGKREVRIWSAGCAGGEEPYSLAILVDQILSGQRGWRISILGTDLNPEFLDRARAARYRPWSFRQTKIHEDRTYFSPDKDEFQLSSRMREHVRFAYLNLVKDVYPSPLMGTCGLDLILFRNVAIYLKHEITKRIIERFHQALRPGGWLLLGEAEVGSAPVGAFDARHFEHATFHQKSQVPETPVGEFPAGGPILADFTLSPFELSDEHEHSAQTQPTFPTIPTLPDWVPLPKKVRTGDSASTPTRSAGTSRIERLLLEQNFDAAEQAIERLTDKNQRASLRFRLAQGLLMGTSIVRARELVDRCLTDEPLMIEAQFLKASFAEEAGDLDQAEKAYRRALYVDRNCPMAHFHLGLVLQQKGDAVGSQRSFKTTLKLIDHRNPHDLVEFGEGVCYGRLKEMIQMIFCS